MFYFFFFFSKSLKPIFILPSLQDSFLTASYENAELNWYCPEKLKSNIIWFPYNWTEQPYFNCIFQMLQVLWNQKSKKWETLKQVRIQPQTVLLSNYSIDTLYAKGEYSLNSLFIDSFNQNPLNPQKFPHIIGFNSILKYFISKGYKLDHDLISYSYDWRFVPFDILSKKETDIWYHLKQNIESSVKAQRKKATLIGISTGGTIGYYFLTQICDQQWKNQYLDKIIFISPIITGVPLAFQLLSSKSISFLNDFQSYDLPAFLESLPILYSLLPNPIFYENRTLVINEFELNCTASYLPTLLKKEIIKKENWPILEKALEFHNSINFNKKNIIGLPTYIIYNSGIRTPLLLKYGPKYKSPKILKSVSGDGIVPSSILEKLLNNQYETQLTFIDLYRDHPHFGHVALPSNPYVLNLVYNLSFNLNDFSGFHQKGSNNNNNNNNNNDSRRLLIAPYVTVRNTTSFEIHSEIRS